MTISKEAFDKHIEEDKRFQEGVHKLLEEINEKLNPIAETYRTATRLQKWAMGTLVSISLLSGIIYSFIQIAAYFNKFK